MGDNLTSSSTFGKPYSSALSSSFIASICNFFFLTLAMLGYAPLNLHFDSFATFSPSRPWHSGCGEVDLRS